MKKISIVLAVVLLLGFGIAMAQENGGQTHQAKNTAKIMRGKGQRAIMNQTIPTSQALPDTQANPDTTASTTISKNVACDGSGRGYGDGSKSQPKDGTGFGAKAQKRQQRNAKLGKGQNKGAQNGNSQRTRRQRRDGSCIGQNNSNTSSMSESK